MGYYHVIKSIKKLSKNTAAALPIWEGPLYLVANHTCYFLSNSAVITLLFSLFLLTV